MQDAIERTKEYVRRNMEEYKDATHDWFHIERVWNTAKLIAKEEGADLFVVEMATLLHDIDDFKFNSHETAVKSAAWLQSLGVDSGTAEKIIHIVENISFKGSAEQNKIQTLEGKVVQDADRLDAIGAFGIARAFTYAGYKNIPIFNPSVEARENMNFEQYKRTEGSAINHFHEKLLLLKDRMNTKTGRLMAEERHNFMESYLRQFFKEAKGES